MANKWIRRAKRHLSGPAGSAQRVVASALHHVAKSLSSSRPPSKVDGDSVDSSDLDLDSDPKNTKKALLRSAGISTQAAVAGVAGLVSETLDGATISSWDVEDLRDELRAIGARSIERSETFNASSNSDPASRGGLLQDLALGGVILEEFLDPAFQVPSEIEEAYRMAYPRLAEAESIGDVIHRSSAEELIGFVSGVKGKLFELRFVDLLNQGGLPEGYQATLATSPVQQGWDIQILDATGNVAELLQAKATDSASYVSAAIDKYPDIDVVTTEEVYAQLVSLGMAEQVQNSGVSNDALADFVEAGFDPSSFDGSLDAIFPSSVGLAVIALAVFQDHSLSAQERAVALGDSGGRYLAASIAAKSLMVATQTWWAGLLVGASIKVLAPIGAKNRGHYEMLANAVLVLELREARRGGKLAGLMARLQRFAR